MIECQLLGVAKRAETWYTISSQARKGTTELWLLQSQHLLLNGPGEGWENCSTKPLPGQVGGGFLVLARSKRSSPLHMPGIVRELR